jgi:hypothetical protein
MTVPYPLDPDALRISSSVGVGSNAYLDRRWDETVLTAQPQRLMDKEALEYVHPDFSSNLDKWLKYLDCYEARDIYKYIFRHSREEETMFIRRSQRGYYYNYVASVVDLFVAYLYHAPIERTAGNLDKSELEEFYSDANLCGDTYHIFIQMVATFAHVTGHCGVLVDAPKLPEGGFRSEEARKKAKHRAYVTLIQPQQIRDWQVDRHGKFTWVKLEVERPEPRDWHVTVDEDTKHYLIWSREDWQEWAVTQGEAKLLDEGPNPLNEVPLVIIRNERCLTHKWMGLSTVRDIADINIAILNWSSLGDEEIYERCLNVLAMERDDGDAPVSLSHNNVLEYAPGTNPPEYLTPGVSPLELIAKWIDRAKDEIYRLAKLGGSTGLMGVREATSGIAYAYEFNETNQSLAKKAESLEQGEIEIHRLMAKWHKKDWDGYVAYPREFGVEDFLAEMQMLSEARMTLTSESAIKEIEKKLVAKLFAREKQDLREKIRKEIESGPARGPGLIESFGSMPGALLGAQGPKPAKPSSASGSKSETGKEK